MLAKQAVQVFVYQITETRASHPVKLGKQVLKKTPCSNCHVTLFRLLKMAKKGMRQCARDDLSITIVKALIVLTLLSLQLRP